jgi:peptide/nickel transport system substrate-binding protein
MKRSGWLWLAASSLILTAIPASAATRPQYGSTLHVVIREGPTSLDPADTIQTDSFARRNLTALIFETLVTLDNSGALRTALATSWQTAPGEQRWQLRLRQGIRFHDGSPLTAEIAASSLRTANPSWNVIADGDTVMIETGTPDPRLPIELASPRNAIAMRNGGGKPNGTGPFRVEDWQPGKKLILGASEDYWRGRAFVDRVEVEMGANPHDELIALELGKAQLVEVAPEQVHREAIEGRQIKTSQPMELIALLFTHDAQTPEEILLRSSLALSVERASIRSVLLQGAGQPTAGILPDWISGYGFLFSPDVDLSRAKDDLAQARARPTWTLGYDSNDTMARLLAERIALNAKDAGLPLLPTTAASTDIHLLRIPLASTDAWVALANVAAVAGMPMPKVGGSSVEDLYTMERSLLTTQRLIPLFHLPVSYAASPAVKQWLPGPDGSWGLADVWLESEKP